MPDVQDYLSLASEAHDFAAWTPDPELAASYRRLAGSYRAVALLHDQISAGGDRELRDDDAQLSANRAVNAVR